MSITTRILLAGRISWAILRRDLFVAVFPGRSIPGVVPVEIHANGSAEMISAIASTLATQAEMRRVSDEADTILATAALKRAPLPR